MSEPTYYTFDVAAEAFTKKAAGYIARRYRNYGVTFEDVSQEIYAWLYGKGSGPVRKWLAHEPQRTTKIYRSMLDIGLGYAEKEKAQRVGYQTDDIHWFSPTMVEGLLPLALDPSYDGYADGNRSVGQHGRKAPNETGDLLTCVIDIRAAIEAEGLHEFLFKNEPGTPAWTDAIAQLVNRLGGETPYRGRRALSNAAAQSITRNQEA